MAASLMSLAFLVAHARAWPFVADGQNRMKLGTSAATAAGDSTYHGIDLENSTALVQAEGLANAALAVVQPRRSC